MPVAGALVTTGSANVMAHQLAELAMELSPYAMITLVLAATMVVTPMLNNAATVLIMGPIAILLAQRLGLSIDPFLMAVTVGASCDFLTPIGHQSNTLVMGPGGYRFTDYWRLGLPLTILVILLGAPLILWVWPV